MSAEQLEEVDILQSIYPEELEVHSDTSFAIHLRLETLPAKQLLIDIDFPEDYPESVIPSIRVTEEEIEDDEDENEDHEDAPDYIYEFTSADLASILRQARETAEENLGMPSVFAIASQIKESAEDIYAEGVSKMQAAHLKEIELAEAKEQEKFKGTAVTKESYREWFANFLAEAPRKPKRPAGILSGREIFERGIEGEIDDDEDDVQG